MTTAFYLIRIYGDVEPSLVGPFKTASKQIAAAKAMHREGGEEDSLFWLDLSGNVPVVGAFDPLTFEEEER